MTIKLQSDQCLPMPLSLLDNAQYFLLLIRPPDNPLGQRTSLSRFTLLSCVHDLLDSQLPSTDVEARLKVCPQLGKSRCTAEVCVITARLWRSLLCSKTITVWHLGLLGLLCAIDRGLGWRWVLLHWGFDGLQFLGNKYSKVTLTYNQLIL